jgi:Tol biopolymer transport system component
MKRTIRKFSYLFVMVLAFVLPMCVQPPDASFDFEGQVVFVDALSERHGITFGRFGNVVHLDARDRSTRLLTNDDAYYAHPTFSPDGSTVWVETKRGTGQYRGLSLDSRLYLIDVTSGRKTPYHSTLMQMTRNESNRSARPVLSPDGRQLYVQLALALRYVVVDLEDGQLQELNLPARWRSLDDVRWSDDGRYLSFSYRSPPGVVSEVAIYDISAGTVVFRASDHFDAPRSGREAQMCTSGSWFEDEQRLAYACYRLGEQHSMIWYYAVGEASPDSGFAVENLRVRAPQVSLRQQKVMFIGSSPVDDGRDVWIAALQGGGLSRVTTTGTEKNWLDWHDRVD